MSVQEPNQEHPTRLDRATQRLDAPVPNLEQLSIAELESLLAEKRRRESKRMLRVIAGRAPGDLAQRCR
jgi:branched-subunit amino acid aminotransferase/4-amino-4-deoxychorismate lyase